MPLRLRPAQGNPIEVDADRTLIGRDKTAEIRLTETSVSRKHATIERRGPQWVITDGGSANGTFLDDVQVAESVLRDGQTLRLGAVSFKVEVEEEPTPTQTLRPSDLETKTQPAVPAYRPPPPAAPVVPVMTPAQAAEMLGIAVGTPPADVRRMYQKNLQELKLACEVLAPGSSS